MAKILLEGAVRQSRRVGGLARLGSRCRFRAVGFVRVARRRSSSWSSAGGLAVRQRLGDGRVVELLSRGAADWSRGWRFRQATKVFGKAASAVSSCAAAVSGSSLNTLGSATWVFGEQDPTPTIAGPLELGAETL